MLEFRSAPTEPALKLTWDEFERMVRRGQVKPTDLVRARVITGDDWWTADNLAVFHRNSKVKHPYGQQLAAEVDAKKRRAEVDWQERITDLEYHWITDFEHGLRLMPLPLVVAEPGVLAASRFIARPSFRADQIVNCVYTESEIRVELITASVRGRSPHLHCELTGDGTWAACPTLQLPLIPVRRETAAIEPQRAPRLLRSARAVNAAAKRAPPCSTMTLDGVGYHHFVMNPTHMLYAYWRNPRGEEHARQLELVAAYDRLVAGFGEPKS